MTSAWVIASVGEQTFWSKRITITVLLWSASLIGLAGFLWPFVTQSFAQPVRDLAPLLAIAVTVAVAVLALIAVNAGMSGARTVALLGTLIAVGMVLRFLGLGFGGVEPVFILIILAGRALGPAFGFALGALVMVTSSLFLGGVGPWLPFQMFAAGWVGLGAGLLPGRQSIALTRGGVRELALLSGYGIVAAYAFGLLLNVWFWPFAVGGETSISFDASASLIENISRFLTYSLVTSTLTWDTVRAIVTAVGIIVLGFPLLAALRRTKR